MIVDNDSLTRRLRERLAVEDFRFFCGVETSGERGGISFIRLRNGDTLFGYSDPMASYYGPHFEACPDEFIALGIEPAGYAAAFDALASYHFENAHPLSKSAFLPRGGVALDIGTRAAHWAVKAARVAGPDVQVIGIDPTAFSERYFALHCDANGLDRCRFVRAAAGAEEGAAVPFYSGSAGESFSGVLQSTFTPDGSPVVRPDQHTGVEHVRLRTIDSIVTELRLEAVDLIILQINGYELAALRGAQDTLARFGPTLFVTAFQNAPGAGSADIRSDVLRFAAGHGYRVLAAMETSVVLVRH